MAPGSRRRRRRSYRKVLGDERDGSTVVPSLEPLGKIGSRVDIGDLLFTAERDFLVKKDGEKVGLVDLKGKTIVLCMIPLDPAHLWGVDHPDMIDAYNQMLLKGDGVEFVLVPVAPDRHVKFPQSSFGSPKDFFYHLLSTIPFPSIPFSDVAACGGRVLEIFSPSYWAVIDQNHTVVTTQHLDAYLFKHFGGDELYPLTPDAIKACVRPTSPQQYISQWDQLLVTPHRDFLLSSNGDEVPVSSLKGKVIGLYFCETTRNPPRMELIKKVYHEAKSLGLLFEIVQINFHYHFFSTRNLGSNPTVEPCHENISWLTLPFKDPSCRKLQRIFNCACDDDWDGDCLVIVNTLQADVLFEFSGAEIFKAYGVAAYPFTRHSLYETEYRRQTEEVTLHLLFPPGEPLLRSSDSVDVSHLSGTRVLVLFADQSINNAGREYISMLESKYKDQKPAEKDGFEVVYVSTDHHESSFDNYRRFMPWLVHPYSVDFVSRCALKVFKVFARSLAAVVAFDEHGKLIAKQRLWVDLNGMWGEKNHQFPFISHDLKSTVRGEVQVRCDLYKHYPYDPDDY